MEKEILEAAISAFISESIKQASEIAEDASSEIKQFFNKGLKRYFEKQKDKYAFIKTLLRGNTPVYLYDIYYHLKIYNIQKKIDTKNIKNIFAESSYVTIVGDAGSGKSTLVKHLFLNSIFEKAGIPILVELRYLNDYDNNFENYIYEKILENKLSQNGKILERLLDRGKFIFFLDGFDEVNSSIKQKLITSLNSFINSYQQNKFILTTRPYSDIENLPLFHNYKVKELEKETGEIEGFVHKQLSSERDLALKIAQSISTNDSDHINSFLTNPLLLSLYILTFQSDSSVPSKKYIFYRRVINALFSEHDSKTKLGFLREKATKLSQEQFEEVLKSFCFISFFENKFSWDYDYILGKLKIIKTNFKSLEFHNNDFIKDLKLAIALWVDDNGMISFAHRSLQEYFAALSVKSLTPNQNKRVYEKIIGKFSIPHNLNETKNFLSLCEEMDELNFKQHYILPLLYELKSLLNTENDDNLGKSYLCFLFTDIEFGKNGENFRPKLNDILFKSIYIHFPYTQVLYDYIFTLTHSSAFDNYFGKNNEDPETSSIYSIYISPNHFPNYFWDICKVEVISLAKEFSTFIESSIKTNEDFINNTIQIDEDLVSLI